MIYSVIYPYFWEFEPESHENITQYCTMALLYPDFAAYRNITVFGYHNLEACHYENFDS